MTKTMSIRMDEDNFDFVSKLSKQEKADISKTVRDLVYKGRVMLAIEKYKRGLRFIESFLRRGGPTGLPSSRHVCP
jgi:hypothetical protein